MYYHHVTVKAVGRDDTTVGIYQLTFTAPTQDAANNIAIALSYARAGTESVSLYFSWEHLKAKWDTEVLVKVPEEIRDAICRYEA